MSKNKSDLPHDFENPFKGRNHKTVWKELQLQSKPISNKQAHELMKKAMKKQNAGKQNDQN